MSQSAKASSRIWRQPNNRLRSHPHAVASCPGRSCLLPLLSGRSRIGTPASVYRYGHVHTRRGFFTDGLPSVLVPPVLFTGLLLTLWTYKCIMTILFQDKIIYMPYMPPFARSEKVSDYVVICRPVKWEQKFISSLDGTRLAICVGNLENQESTDQSHRRELVICYFHGNGSSVPPRLPLLSGVLREIANRMSGSTALSVRHTIVALSYRGYWTSSGRASQAGIEQDAQALLQWIATEYGPRTEVILWGQSIGAGVASSAAASWLSKPESRVNPIIRSMILETPFTSIKGMLLALYPQKWLPYRYLWPFLWNHWDTEMALKRIADSKQPLPILLVPATRDEVVPPTEADRLQLLCQDLRLPVTRRDVVGALHTNATIRQEGQNIVAEFVVSNVESRKLRKKG